MEMQTKKKHPTFLSKSEQLQKAKSKYPVETITNADYIDDLALLTNTPAQLESLQHRLGQIARGISLCFI